MGKRRKAPTKPIELDGEERKSDLDEPPEYEEVKKRIKVEEPSESIPEVLTAEEILERVKQTAKVKEYNHCKGPLRKLQNKLLEFDHVIMEVPTTADGFFRALSKIVHFTEIYHRQVREHVADGYLAHKGVLGKLK